MFIYFILMILFLTIFVFICRYPTRSDCPDWSGATNPEVEDEPWHSDSYSMNNYYFPDFGHNSCGFGRDYPGKHTRSSKPNQICAYDID